MELFTDPDDWEAQALLPARLLAGTDPQVRTKLREAERHLYLLILEGLGSQPTGSTLAYEVQTLVGELWIIERHLKALGEVEGVARELEAILRDAERSLGAPTLDSGPPVGDDPGIRPFILSLSCQEHFQTCIRKVGEGVTALRRAPERPDPPGRPNQADRQEWLSALLADLRWVMKVLREHIATRAEISCLRPGETRLCSMANFLARSLEKPAERLERAVRGVAVIQEADS